MPTLILVRHGQASFGADDYDNLSALGHEQAVVLGRALAERGITPDLFACGTMKRQAQTLAGIKRGLNAAMTDGHHVISGLNEYDFSGLLDAHFAGRDVPAGLHTDRKVHFAHLRQTVRAWQNDEIKNPPETWDQFSDRTHQARLELMAMPDAKTVLAVSSGGAIARIVADVLQCPSMVQIELQLQIKNASMTTLIYSTKTGACYLNAFNETPFVTQSTPEFLTYS